MTRSIQNLIDATEHLMSVARPADNTPVHEYDSFAQEILLPALADARAVVENALAEDDIACLVDLMELAIKDINESMERALNHMEHGRDLLRSGTPQFMSDIITRILRYEKKEVEVSQAACTRARQIIDKLTWLRTKEAVHELTETTKG